jgi:hypothetical protein
MPQRTVVIAVQHIARPPTSNVSRGGRTGRRAGDWITVADTLEYDVAPLTPRFDAVIDSLR